MPQPVQTYANHARILPPFHYFVLPVLFLNVLREAWSAWAVASWGAAFDVVVAVALLMAAVLARVMALTVQDRVIRLEMRLRLREVLPPDLRQRINDLTPGQLVGLRFASDVELTDLIREALAGSLTTRKAIKQKIKNWQADYLRA